MQKTKHSITEREMEDKIRSYVTKLAKKWDSVEFTFKRKSDKKIELSTDGTMYELLYDPFSSEAPYLAQEAAKEFGHKYVAPDIWKYYNELNKLIEKNGWTRENYGGGIIEFYKDY